MGLSNVNITLGNGNIGSVSLSDDGIAGLIVTGTEIEGKLDLNRAYVLGSIADLEKLGITKTSNPLAYEDVSAYYAQAGTGAELHLLVTSLKKVSEISANNENSPIKKLVKSAGGRIRMVGINVLPAGLPTENLLIDADLADAVAAAQTVAEDFASQMWPIRVLVPALSWNGKTEIQVENETQTLYQPRSGSYNRVSVVLCSDKLLVNPEITGDKKEVASAAIGQVLGRIASIPVHHSIARVRDGAIAAKGYLTNGQKPEESHSLWNMLDENGYIFYRTFIGKNGYYLNDDPMCVSTTDDYAYLNLGRVIDKAIIVAYKTYIDDLMDNVVIDEKGQIPAVICKSFEASINRSVNANMGDEISSFTSYINPAQDVLTTSSLEITCKIVPQGILREINVNLSFSNPTAN